MRFLKADKVFDGEKFLSEKAVLVVNSDNSIREIISEKNIESSRIERLEGIVTPGFINAHCHLELSHLKNVIPQHTGLVEFGKGVIGKRNTFSKEEIQEHIHLADAELYRNGIVAIGDISNTEDTFDKKRESKVFYHTFIELIGLDGRNADSVFEKGVKLFETLNKQGLTGSLTPHAPYSVSNELLRKISEFDLKNRYPISIHNQESLQETNFFMGEKSEIQNLYAFLNIDISWFKAPGVSSFQSVLPSFAARPAIFVHNTFTRKEDLIALPENNIFWCFCPAANLYIENCLPDYSLFKNRNICIGTDSLASNTQLDLLHELNLISEHSNVFSVEELLKAITSNAAQALGLENKFGTLTIGKNVGLNLIQEKNSKLKLIQKIC